MTDEEKTKRISTVLARCHFRRYAGANQFMANEGEKPWVARSAVHFEADAKAVVDSLRDA